MKRSATCVNLLSVLGMVAVVPTLAAQNGQPAFRMHALGVATSTVAAVRGDLDSAAERIQKTLGSFRDTVSVRIFPSRETFDRALRDAWGLQEIACWMVGGADDHVLFLLSPAVWGEKHVCEHDPKDELHRQLLIAHELVHVYHGQINPSADLGTLDDLGWFIEGLATYISGQLETSHGARARDAVVAGALPQRLADAWSGPYRYSISGSMVSFIDERWGRQVLRNALKVTSQTELLELLGITESEFIRAWQEWARKEP